MNSKKLFEALKIVGDVRSNTWSQVMRIVELMPTIEIKEKKWNDKYKENNIKHFPLDLSKIETWSTYDNRECINLVFSNENNKLICKVSIYDGDAFREFRTNLRFTATLIMPNNFIKELEEKILYRLDRLAEDSYEESLENQKKLWKHNFKLEILGIKNNIDEL